MKLVSQTKDSFIKNNRMSVSYIEPVGLQSSPMKVSKVVKPIERKSVVSKTLGDQYLKSSDEK